MGLCGELEVRTLKKEFNFFLKILTVCFEGGLGRIVEFFSCKFIVLN